MGCVVEKAATKRCLEIAREAKRSHEFFDVHVHPFEIFFNDFRLEGQMSRGDDRPREACGLEWPDVTDFVDGGGDGGLKVGAMFSRPDLAQKKIAALYAEKGLRPFVSQMELCGIDRVLLLPVASSESAVEAQLLEMERVFGGDRRFYFAWSLSNSTRNEDVAHVAGKAVERYGVQAVKVHPAVAEIDLTSCYGKEKVESALQFCGQHRLPMLVHGGKSALARDAAVRTSGCIRNLCEIDWGTSKAAVVMAHAGAYGCGSGEMKEDVLPRLTRLLSKHDNVVVDISGLGILEMESVLQNVEAERILFGSDALYEPMWKALAKLMAALDRTTTSMEEALVKIISTNPRRLVFQKNFFFKEGSSSLGFGTMENRSAASR